MVGRVGRPHGVRGLVLVVPDSDQPGRFAHGARFHAPGGRELVVREVQIHRGSPLVAFEGVENRESAELLRGLELTIDPAERRPLARDEFWPDELIGLEVRLAGGDRLGMVRGVEAAANQDRLVVETADGALHLVPFVAELVPEVRMEDGYLVIRPPEGLLGNLQRRGSLRRGYVQGHDDR
ncbi:MAG: ribosome maturation factor RimM [Acidimicrobiia bacterium]